MMLDRALVSAEAWVGVWLRARSGPTAASKTGKIEVSLWHQTSGPSTSGDRLVIVCGYGPRGGFTWPSGGARLEIARPLGFGALPGDVCHRCTGWHPALQDDETLVDPTPR